MAVYLGEYQVGLGGLTDLSGASVVNNQNKTVNPSTSQQTVTFDSGYTGLGTVTVTAMPSLTLPTSTSGSATSGYSSKATIGRSTSDQYINIGTGYNAAGAYYKISAVPNGTAGTPTATKGTVSNYSVSVTPSVTNTAGYISSETKTGTAVTVTASELVSGTLSVTSNGTKDVTNYASISVNVPTGSTINNQDKTVTPSTSEQSISADNGYTGLGTVTVEAMPSGTTGTPSASKGTVSNHSVSVTPSVTNTTGYITGGTKTGTAVTVTASELASGNKSITSNGSNIDVVGYSTVSVNVSGGGGITPTGNLDITESGTIDVTNYATVTVPVADASAASASIQFITENSVRKWQLVYEAYAESAGWVDEGGFGISHTYKYNAVAANTTITPTTSVQTIGGANHMMEGAVTVAAMPSGTAGTPSASKGTVSNHTISVTPSVTNTTGYITGGTKTGTAVTVSASELVSGSQTFTSNNTYDVTNLASIVVNVSGGGGGGGGTAAKVETATATPTYASTSISFTGLLGEPTSFAVVSNADLATGASPWKTAAVVYDGTDLHGQTIRNTSNAQVTYDGSSFSYTYNNGTLTITGSGTNFQANQYKLVYTYGSATVGTAQTQVGSGATSITFTGVTDEPAYFSCIFKSNFSTSSGYQRVIVVVNDGTSTYGMEMDSSAKVSTAHWSYNYNNGSLTITSQGTNAGGYFHQPGYYQLTYVAGGGDEVILQDKTVSPTESTQYITADEDYTGLGMVTVNAISSTYVGSGITQRSSTDLTASGATVTVPAGYYSTQATKSVASGTAGTPTASKGTVSNHSISITPSVTNTTGYITGGTKTGTAVTVSASELVSGSETKTSNGTYDVTNLAELVVNVASSSPTIQSLSITPSTSEQTFNSSSVDGYKPVTVAAMPAITLPTAVSTTSSGTSKATLSLTGGTRYLNIPTGYNGTAQYYTLSVANGSATGPSSITQSSATVSTGTNTLTLTKTNVTTTPTVSAGYVSSATASTATVTLTASVTTKAAATITPGTTDQTIAAGTYLTGIQTIAGDADLVGGNILSTANIFGVQGTVVVQNYYTGSSAPSSSTGSNGDLYLQS